MYRFFSAPIALTAILSPATLRAQDMETSQAPFFGPWAKTISDWWDGGSLISWVWGGLIALAVLLFVLDRFRQWRRKVRVSISGMRNGPRFRLVDTMCHAVWKGRKINEARLARALQIARDATDMDFTLDHLREIAIRTDRLRLPRAFYWLRDGLTSDERLLVFNASVLVMLADGPLVRADRKVLRSIANGLRLKEKHLRDLARLIDP